MSQRAGDTRTAREYDAHLARIRDIIASWHRGEIGPNAKRQQIADENAIYYGEDVRGNTGTDLTATPRVVDEVVHRLAERMMIPAEAASSALAATRDAGWKAAHTDDQDEAARLQKQGRDAYLDILRTAR